MKLEKSNEIDKIALALSKAQAAMRGAKEDSINPHFKANYADLASIWAACREALTAQELAVTQTLSAEAQVVTVTTMLIHSSGQWICGDLSLTARDASPQAVGSAITYARRYSLAAIVGVAPEDDDGNDAQPTPKKTAADSEPSGKMIDPAQFDALATITADLVDLGHWKSKNELRDYMKANCGKDTRQALTYTEAANIIGQLQAKVQGIIKARESNVKR